MTHELLEEFKVVIEIPVAWGDMDAFQHVNNARYFTYFESARLSYIERVGFLNSVDEDGIGPILAAIDCRFRLPLTYPDTILVGARVTEMGDDRFNMVHRVVSLAHGRIAAEGTGLIVTYDYRSGRKAPIPDRLREKIEALDAPQPLSSPAGG